MAGENEVLARVLRSMGAFSNPRRFNTQPIPTMPTDIETSRAFVKERTEKTREAQSTLAADSAWTWLLKTLAAWDADIVAMDATVNASLAKTTAALEVDMLAARGFLDARLDAIHKYTLLTVGVMRVRAKTLPGLIDIVKNLSARGDSRRAIEDEAVLSKPHAPLTTPTVGRSVTASFSTPVTFLPCLIFASSHSSSSHRSRTLKTCRSRNS